MASRSSLLQALLVLLLSACSGNRDLYLRDELANQGPVALSGKNPFMSANLFVAKEMKASEVFRGFITYRGTPDAVEVRKSYLKPLRVYLFYLTDSEAFLLEKSSADWLVRGPDKIPPQLMASFFNMQAPGTSAPLALDGVSEIEDRYAASGTEPPPALEVPVKNLRPVPPRAPKSKKPEIKPSDNIQESDTVKESSSGDLIHRVTFPGESLRLLASWYTGDVNNTGRIARINGIEKPDLLVLDSTVRIPRYLLKTTRALPQSEVRKFDAGQ